MTTRTATLTSEQTNELLMLLNALESNSRILATRAPDCDDAWEHANACQDARRLLFSALCADEPARKVEVKVLGLSTSEVEWLTAQRES